MEYLKNQTFKWIFVGGGSGVGKTSISITLSIYFSRFKKNVLLVSLNPTMCLSDFFQQSFKDHPLYVKGFKTLSAMEFPFITDKTPSYLSIIDNHLDCLFVNALSDEYDMVIFDTSSTSEIKGLLSMIRDFSKVQEPKMGLSSLFEDFSPIKYRELKMMMLATEKRLKYQTTFICVSTLRYAALKETECLLQYLNEKNINSRFIILNKIIGNNDCAYCRQTLVRQASLIRDVDDVYSEYIIIEIPFCDYILDSVEKCSWFFESFRERPSHSQV